MNDSVFCLVFSAVASDGKTVLFFQLNFVSLYVSTQVNTIRGSTRSYMITDALSGSDYVIQLRMKEEYDGQWSEWSSPVNSTSWTGK